MSSIANNFPFFAFSTGTKSLQNTRKKSQNFFFTYKRKIVPVLKPSFQPTKKNQKNQLIYLVPGTNVEKKIKISLCTWF
jgi:hypothetical protein